MPAAIDDDIKIQNFKDIRLLRENGKILTVFGSAPNRFLQEQGGLLVYDDGGVSLKTIKDVEAQARSFCILS